jgi:uncharacterized membrane protein YkoI
MRSIAAILIGVAALASSAFAAAKPQPPPGPPPGNDSLGADWGAQQNEAREGVRHGRYAPLGKVIREINRRDPGYQLDAGIEQQGGRAVYRVRWASSHGRRIDYIVDALSGAILRAQ